MGFALLKQPLHKAHTRIPWANCMVWDAGSGAPGDPDDDRAYWVTAMILRRPASKLYKVSVPLRMSPKRSKAMVPVMPG